jgi:hypothetical protein
MDVEDAIGKVKQQQRKDNIEDPKVHNNPRDHPE